MRSTIVVILKTFLGGVAGALIFLWLGSLKGVFDALREFGVEASKDPTHILFFPNFLLFFLMCLLLGAWYALWLGGDYILLAALLGFEIAFLISIRKVIFSRFSKRTAGITLGAVFLFLVMTCAFGFYYKAQRMNQIETALSNFCAAVQAGDYPAAYLYFSPEYRSRTNLDRFIESELWPESILVTSCHASFISSFGNKASIFPDAHTVASFSDFPSGPEYIMKYVDGGWYLTGEFHWYMD